MKLLLSLAASAVIALSAQSATAQTARTESVQRAAAVVNGVVISNFDLDQRVRMILSTSGGAATEAARQRLREQVLRTLIDEILQLNAAREAGLQVTPQEVEESLQKIADQNGTTPEKILASLEAAGIYPGTARRPGTLQTQIRAEIAWSKLLEERIASRVNISEEAVDQEMRRIEAGATKPQFLASEIFISVDSPADDARARRNITQIHQQIMSGTPFPALAQQFSESATATRGGDMGWVQDGDLPPEVWRTLEQMRPLTISPPVRTANGYYLIALRDKMRPAGSAVEKAPAPPGRPAGVPAGSVKLKRVVLGLPGRMSAAEQESFMRAAAGLRDSIKGCQGLDDFARQLQGVVVLDLPILPVKDLAPEIQQVIQGLNPSDVSQPFFSREGEQNLMNLLVVCGDRPRVDFVATRVFEMPTREQVSNRMFSQSLSVAARRYMRDLRRDAAIEIRDPSLADEMASN